MLVALVAAALVIEPARGQTVSPSSNPQEYAQRLEELKAMKKDLARTMRDFDARIRRLEAAMREERSERSKLAAQQEAMRKAPSRPVPPDSWASESAAIETAEAQPPPPPPPPPASSEDTGILRAYVPGKGFVLASGDTGEISLGLISYLRFLDQLGLNHTYRDSFGRTTTLNLREDIFLNKVNLSFKGWLFDPDFSYRVWVWTQNTAMGQTAQVVVGGHMEYRFFDWLIFGGGVGPLPTTRSTNWSYPFWLKMDNRTIADEFFRGSYTFGIWSYGKIGETIGYRAMLANNLSALGIDAGQLPHGLNTESIAVWWMPTTGEFGPALGFGDYEDHQDVATMFGVHYTRSREDSQDQPNVNTFDNTQIRLSDGTLLFSPNAFDTIGQVNKATYQMLDIDAGFKYLGWSLEGEFYTRWVNSFKTTGFVPVGSLFDQGFQAQASAMVLPKKLQAYAAGSEVFGQYGRPWDFSVGLNWFPFLRREVRWNVQAVYLYHSPVGGLSYPYIVGGTGWFYNSDLAITF